MNTVFTLCGLGIISVFASAIVKELYPDYLKWIALSYGLICMSLILPGIGETIKLIQGLSTITENKYIAFILRALGIIYITSLAGEICNSVENVKINSYIELVGKTEIIILSIPLFRDLINMVLL